MLEGLTPPIKDRLCIIGQKASDLSKEDVKILNDAINNRLWSATGLAEELSKRGFVIGRGSIDKHRKKLCLCFKE